MKWFVAPRVRCDLVAYGAPSCQGMRKVVRLFPTGSRRGDLRPEDLKSLVILAPVGHRVILCTDEGEAWEGSPWRCIRITAEHRFKNDAGNEGVRVPDLDWLDPADARKVNPDRQESYPFAASLAEGAGWTFGRIGPPELKGNVVAIRVDRE